MRGNTIQKQKLLVVEGNHEDDFFEAWLKHLDIAEIQAMPIGGKTKLRDNLQALVRQPKFRGVTSLVVVRDGDDNPTGAFQSVIGALQACGLPQPAKEWIWRADTNPMNGSIQIKVAVAILPDGQNHGALEELLMQTVKASARTHYGVKLPCNSAARSCTNGYGATTRVALRPRGCLSTF